MMYFFSEDCFSLANSADPDEMPPYVAFHLGLHCLPKYIFLSVARMKRVNFLSRTSNMLYKVCNCYCLRCVNVTVGILICDNLYITNTKRCTFHLLLSLCKKSPH